MKIRKLTQILAVLAAFQSTLSWPQVGIPEKSGTFSLSISEDRESARRAPGLHRITISLKQVQPGFDVEAFHPEAEDMYEAVVTHHGATVPERNALKALEAFRHVDSYPTIDNPRSTAEGQVRVSSLDIGDYYDMSAPGTYKVVVTRRSPPHEINRAKSTLVRSNTLSIVVAQDVSGETGEKPNSNFSLALERADPEMQYAIKVSVELRNTSRKIIREAKCWPFLGMYRFLVFRDGQPVQGNTQWEELEKARADVSCPGNETLNELQPNDIDEDEIPLSNFFDLTQPGIYTVFASKETAPWTPSKSTTVLSNAINFNVVVPASPGVTLPDAGKEN
ncbi:MAG TPA: hypothetical protein VGN16_04795 [Acidobacteriaceae bacterium]